MKRWRRRLLLVGLPLALLWLACIAMAVYVIPVIAG